MNLDLQERFFKHVVYPAATELRGQAVRSVLQRLNESQWFKQDALRQLQTQKLRRLLADVHGSVAWYRQASYSLAGGAGNDDPLQRLPTIGKLDIKEHREDFLLSPMPSGCTWKTTGGSTGQPVTLAKSSDAMAQELAAAWRGYAWAGVDIGSRQARFWGVPHTRPARLKARLTDLACNRRRYSAFQFSDDDLARYSQSLHRFKPRYLYGYVSMLTALANHVLVSNSDFQVPLVAVITTAELLSPTDRALLETAFRCRVYNEYGCGEVGTIAHECERGSLHLNDENMIVEILRGEETCSPGEKGEIVVTELNNRAMPLIRYRTGDFGSIAPVTCDCGRGLRVLEEVYGRAYDFVVDSKGRKYHGEFLVYVFEDIQRRDLGIAQFQVQQLATSAVMIRVVPLPTTDLREAETVIRREIARVLGDDMTVDVEWVIAIPREASGKMRVIVGMPQR